VKTISRRSFLRGAGGVAISLPFLNVMGCGKSSSEREVGRTTAAGGTLGAPKRFVVFFSANGTMPDAWRPSGGETGFTLGPILAPLAAHQNDIVVIDGVDMESSNHGPGDGHQKGMGHMLTGTELLEGDLFTGGNGELAGWAGGISVDQAIANAIGGTTRFKSLELGVQVSGATVWSRMSYLAADQPIPPEDNPYNAFDRVFADLGADPLGLQKLRAQRHSVLDVVKQDYESLNSRLGAEDKTKLDQHLTAIRDIELRLDNGAQVGGACAIPTLEGGIDVDANDNFPIVGRLQMDMLIMALTCDLTRVASLQWSNSVSNKRFTWLDIPDGHHDLSHLGDSDTVAVDKIVRINTWYAEQFAYLIQRMKEIPEGDGTTLLDNTLMIWCNELGKGNSHTRMNAPFVLAGRAGGALQTGRFLAYDGTVYHNDLLVSCMNAMGVDADTFGNPAYCTGPLTGLL
jgi:hypothetical protein